MGVFDSIKTGEGLFKNTVALDYDYMPRAIPYREGHQRYIATCIKPLFNNSNGRNVVVHGKPGIGKTLAVKNLFDEINEQTDDIYCMYINCWKKNTMYKILIEMCDFLGYEFTANKRTDELFKIVTGLINKKSAVICFDEIDKLEEIDFLYMLLEELYRKSLILITNYSDWLVKLDNRIKSRLTPDLVEFQSYTPEETYGILEERSRFAFADNVWEKNAFQVVAVKSSELEDIRSGLYMMREAGHIAELEGSKKITLDHVKKAISKLDEYTIKNSSDLDTDVRIILQLCKSNPNSKIGDLFDMFLKKGGSGSYKTFQRKIMNLEENKFLSVAKNVGADGNTSMVSFVGATRKKDVPKTLGDFGN